MTDCIFCRIGRGELSSDMLYRDDRCFAIRDIHPVAPTHVLVIPFEHIVDLGDGSPEHEALLGRLIAVAKEVARKEDLEGRGFRIVVNQGQDAGQALDHLHVHVLGGKQLRGMA